MKTNFEKLTLLIYRAGNFVFRQQANCAAYIYFTNYRKPPKNFRNSIKCANKCFNDMGTKL